MESFSPSTVKHWNKLPNHVKNASAGSSFKSILKSHFCRKDNKLFHFGERRRNIWHCQIRNSAGNLNLDLYNQSLSATPMCLNCTDVIEDAYHNFLICPKYAVFREILFQSIQSITGNDYQPELELLLYGSRDY
jgi:hypothetical protein